MSWVSWNLGPALRIETLLVFHVENMIRTGVTLVPGAEKHHLFGFAVARAVDFRNTLCTDARVSARYNCLAVLQTGQ